MSSQNLNLSFSGIFTSMSDYNGLPPGAVDAADNIESRYKNTAEPRRGFAQLDDSLSPIRMTDFPIGGVRKVIALTSSYSLLYYDGSTPWAAISGNSTNIQPPNSTNAKSRFVTAGNNLYVTAKDGVRSLASGSGSVMVRAGIPKALDIQATTNGASSGFFTNNSILTTTGNLTSGNNQLSQLGSTTGVTVGLYVSESTGKIPAGTTVTAVTSQATIIVQTGNTTAGSTTISSLASTSGLSAGNLVSGTGIPSGAKIVSTTATTVTLDVSAYQTATGSTFTFSTAPSVTLSQNATGNVTAGTIQFYAGSQVAYCILYGRVDTDLNGRTITRLGTASPVVICTNTLANSTNVTVTATLPKNAQNRITFYQLYRSVPTESISIAPQTQYNLVYEAQLTNTDFTNRTISITDLVSTDLVGIPLYSGSDQEGITQSNDPPPTCWDLCNFRTFSLYANITFPTTLEFTIVSVGSPSGVQTGDTITIAGTFLGSSFSRVFTGASSENAASRQFKVYTTGTSSQNIANTADSLIRVINYDQACPVHAFLLSSATDLPGQILLEADDPNTDTFTVTASAHTSAYDPALSNLTSTINTQNNAVAISKDGELEAVPALNVLTVGNSSGNIVRVIPLRDYIVVLKTDGIYKIIGTSPNGLVVNPFDLTTRILGADTAVSLNSGVWMFSNQGVVSISDGGVDAKSVPIDDQLNELIGSNQDALTESAFAIGYESDRKYILCVPTANTTFANLEYNYNYVTQAWTTWTKSFYCGFVHSDENKLYVSRGGSFTGVSYERKSGNYTDFADEAIDVTVTSVSGTTLTLDSVENISVGDLYYQSSTVFSPITAVNATNSTITLQYSLSYTTGARQVLSAYTCSITWKQVFADNPAFVRQYSEGVALFKNTRFTSATATFASDFSPSEESVTLTGTGNPLWGVFPWGSVPWGVSDLPSKIRFYIPQNKQLGSFVIPALSIRQAWGSFTFQGMSISYSKVSSEVGL